MEDLIQDFVAETRERLDALDSALSAFREGELAVTPSGVSARLETVDLIRTLIDALQAIAAEPAGDDSGPIARLEAVPAPRVGAAARPPPAAAPAGPLPTPAVDPAAATIRPLIERLGGDATVDTACAMIMDNLCAEPIFVGADRDRLRLAVREGLIALARGSQTATGFAGKLAALGPTTGSDEAVAHIGDMVSRAFHELEVAPDEVDDLLARLADIGVTAEPGVWAAPPRRTRGIARELDRTTIARTDASSRRGAKSAAKPPTSRSSKPTTNPASW